MQIYDIPERKFKKIKPLELPNSIFNTEAQMFLISCKNKWDKENFVLKKYYWDYGEIFSNKLYTIHELLDKKDIINIEELVMPTSLAAINSSIVGFLMPYIPNINFQEILKSSEFTLEQKINYFKQIGELLEKMETVRKYTSVKEFFLNDIHENNFILNTQTGKINAVDLDSCKIDHNLTCGSRYLSCLSQLPKVSKYTQLTFSVGGEYIINEDTEMYCYIVMIMNFLFGGNITKLSIDDYFIYLEYLSKLGVSKELIDLFSYIYINHNNENPKDLLDELIPFYGKTNVNTFESVLKRKIR